MEAMDSMVEMVEAKLGERGKGILRAVIRFYNIHEMAIQVSSSA